MLENTTLKQIANEFSVTGFKELETSRGVAFNGVINYQGKKVGRFENEGRGGMTDFDFSDKTAGELFSKYALEICDERSEPEAALAEFLTSVFELKKKFAKSVKKYSAQAIKAVNFYGVYMSKGINVAYMLASEEKAIEEAVKDGYHNIILFNGEETKFFGNFNPSIEELQAAMTAGSAF